jgi:O-antigen/teichoic acid export membrane protein
MSETKTMPAPASNRDLAATIGKNTIFGIVASGVQIATRLVSVPVVIHYLGIGGYGIWSIIMVTAAYLRFGTAGIKSAFQKYVAEATGSGDFERANKLVSTGSISMLLLSLAGLIPVAVFSHKLAVSSGVPPEFISSAASSITVLAAIYVISNFGAAYESIVMGGHRIDLTRKYITILAVLEAIAVIALLHAGYGLFAMALAMGVSELIYIFCCYRASRRIVPQMHISVANFTPSLFPELFRFAGSYQMVNMLELFYRGIVPIAILKFFGDVPAGIYALAGRLTSSALIGQDALALPILSGGTMVFTSGTAESLKLFFSKSFKVTIAATLPPLAFVCAFGTILIYAWTGVVDPQLRIAIWLVSLAMLPKSVSLLQLVLYRASGRTLHDNISQIIRIVMVLIVAHFGMSLGFSGVLAGMAFAEYVGVTYMVFAMARTFHAFDIKILTRDALRITAATVLVIGAGMAAGMIPIQLSGLENLHFLISLFGGPERLHHVIERLGGLERINALVKLSEVGIACLLMSWPALLVTKSISTAERRSILDSVMPGRRRVLQANS